MNTKVRTTNDHLKGHRYVNVISQLLTQILLTREFYRSSELKEEKFSREDIILFFHFHV